MQVMKQHTVDEDTGNIWKHIIHTWHTKGIRTLDLFASPSLSKCRVSIHSCVAVVFLDLVELDDMCTLQWSELT